MFINNIQWNSQQQLFVPKVNKHLNHWQIRNLNSYFRKWNDLRIFFLIQEMYTSVWNTLICLYISFWSIQSKLCMDLIHKFSHFGTTLITQSWAPLFYMAPPLPIWVFILSFKKRQHIKLFNLKYCAVLS